MSCCSGCGTAGLVLLGQKHKRGVPVASEGPVRQQLPWGQSPVCGNRHCPRRSRSGWSPRGWGNSWCLLQSPLLTARSPIHFGIPKLICVEKESRRNQVKACIGFPSVRCCKMIQRSCFVLEEGREFCTVLATSSKVPAICQKVESGLTRSFPEEAHAAQVPFYR